MAKEKKSISEIVNDHKPKNFKFKFIFKDDEILKELEAEKYDLSETDTICNDELTQAAYQSEFRYFEREIVGKAKEPTDVGDGIVISKQLITKADKKLQQIGIGYFSLNNVNYVCIKFMYERFDIIEIFIKI